LKGIYVLLIRLRRNCTVRVGALGDFVFENGVYAYVGSAQNGLEMRIKRHLRKEKRLFWHIDYLLAHSCVQIESVLFKKAEKVEECQVAILMSEFGKHVEGFGCSDCKCQSHLFKLSQTDFLFNAGFFIRD
jgi:Uri superfamily endonuclease